MISYSCGLNVGTPKWREGRYDWVNESKECSSEGVVELIPEDVEFYREECFSMFCPVCGGELFQDMDHFEEIYEEVIL